MTGTYKITATFTRSLSDDGELLRDQQKDHPLLSLREVATRQFTAELQEAYMTGSVAGLFEVTGCDLVDPTQAAADAKFKETYPEVVRWGEVAADARTILEFLDWACDGSSLTDLDEGRTTALRLVYRFFQINEGNLERDRHRLYEAARKNPQAVVAAEKKES